jgi:superkiller protein 3
MRFRSFAVVFVSSLLFSFIPAQLAAAQDAMAAIRGDRARSEPAISVPVDAGPAANGVDPYALTRKGTTLVGLGLYKDAAPLFEQAADRLSGSATAWLNLSIVYDHLDRVGDSLAAARHALELEPANVVARAQVCDLSTSSKLYEEAVACYSELQNTAKLDDRTLSNFGIAALGIGDLDHAQSLLEEVGTRQPHNAELFNALGVIRYKRNDLPRAIAYFKRAIETSPDRGLFRYNMAVAQMAGNNRAAVLSQYKLLQYSDPELAASLARFIFKDKLIFVTEK